MFGTIKLEYKPNPPRVTGDWVWSSHYVRRFWLPVVGPSTFTLYENLHMGFFNYITSDDELCWQLGLGDGRGANSPFVRTLQRGTRFGFWWWDSQASRLDVFQHLTNVPARHVARFPKEMQRAHREYVERGGI